MGKQAEATVKHLDTVGKIRSVFGHCSCSVDSKKHKQDSNRGSVYRTNDISVYENPTEMGCVHAFSEWGLALDR